jgi:DNA-binding SARP family transcriptional activator
MDTTLRPALYVQLLGSPRIVNGTPRSETRLPTQTLLLLAILVTRKDEILDREEIAFTLWPDYSESDARAALRRHLHNLQQALPKSEQPWIVCDAKTISWARSEDTYVDVFEFERLSERPETFRSAAEIYAGDFLPRIDHEWVTSLRERLRRRACRVFEQLISHCWTNGEKRKALEFVEQLLVHDPWREDALRHLLALRFHAGDRAGALAYYRGFCKRLESELGVDPMPETIKCAEAIIHGYAPQIEA